MRKALLDTDILSEILKGKNETVRQRASAYQAQRGDLTICAVTVMEVVKGLHRLGREEAVGRFLSGQRGRSTARVISLLSRDRLDLTLMQQLQRGLGIDAEDPEQTEPRTVPSKHGLRFDQEQGMAPLGKE